jgi:hypothetical protein
MNHEQAPMHDAFMANLLGMVPTTPATGARAFFNEDGDCIEILTANESYYGERIDDLLTVFYGRESGKVVGGVIKGAKAFVRKTLDCAPGFAAEFCGGNVRVEYLLTAAMWAKGKDKMAIELYMQLRDIADKDHLSVPMQLEHA